jgi:small subunit ribosomal protein S17
MAEDETPQVDDAAQEPAVAAAAEESAAAEAPEEPAADEAAVAEPVAEEAAADEAAAGEPVAEEAPHAAPPAPPREPVEVLAPKERRRRRRAAKEPATRAAMSHEERQAERDALRVRKAAARRGERAKDRAAKPAVAAAPSEPIEHAVGRPKLRQGVVVSDKADKTITVRVDTAQRHRRFKKVVRRSKTLHAHDEGNEAHEGDLVRVIETRPLSATKRWRLVEVVERAR